ncbi:MAG: sigma 54-interacting transcriptional regulator [Deltaproteobacteria bacterium]
MTDDAQTRLQVGAQHPVIRAERPFVLRVGDVEHGPFMGSVSVGSAASNGVVLDDPTVSRFHFELSRDQRGIRIVDVGSKNGTFVGDARVRDATIDSGAHIRVGDTVLELSVNDTPELVQDDKRSGFGGLMGTSPAMQALFRLLEKLAAVDTPVLVQGETGTGKDLVARALHEQGRRAAGPFVVFDCGAVAPTLAESELFGHVRGAFTGADADREGAFERAAGGTLFLDEIGELDSALQPKLLRALESKTVRRVGGAEERAVDVRVVAATHRDLRQMVNAGTFREDLFHRIAVFLVRVPPLRERPDDIEALAQHFLARALAGTDFSAAPKITPASLSTLVSRAWTGNVRELRNVVERALVLGDLELAVAGDLSSGLVEREAEGLSLEEAKRRFERSYLVRLLARHDGDRAAAATEADVHVKSLGRLLRRHGLVQS